MNVSIPGRNGACLLESVDARVETEHGDVVERHQELVEIGSGVYEATLRVHNQADHPITVTRLDALSATLQSSGWSTHWFTSSWGQEFTPHSSPLTDEFALSIRSGRSSNGTHPWLGLERDDAALIITPAWSGNWHITHRLGHITAGISPWRFATTLAPGEDATAPSVIIAAGTTIAEAAAALTTAVGRSWVPRTAASDSMRVEWNHWWPYEDVEVDADIIDRNAAIAARVGIRQVTVDAGWFGPAGDTFWEDVRGDWDVVNRARFRSGLDELGRRIRGHGAVPGIWIEPEAVGVNAALRAERPELMARSEAPSRGADDAESSAPQDPANPGFIGYVCLGSPAGREFVTRALDSAVSAIDAEWVKLDFNLDPGAGCTRTDHGHGARDGLYRHYLGLYEVLDEFRVRHPDVILESCSSGGLRIDLGLARHVHCAFLSDPDYTEHHLQVLWGAAHMLPPAAMLHWSWSQCRGDYEPAQLDFATLTAADFAATLRAAMLHRFGISLRLPELRPELLITLEQHIRIYTEQLAPLLRDGVLTPLTAQPLRDGHGERTPIFRISAGDRHLIAVIVLPGGEPPATVQTGVAAGKRYRARDLVTGAALEWRDGSIRLEPGTGESSWLIMLDPDIAGQGHSVSVQ